jgi:phosphate transport system ATP-binding protein
MEPTVLAENFSVSFNDTLILRSVNLALYPGEILSIIGPARSGKSTFLRCLNRLNDLIPGMHHKGRILFDSQDIYGPDVNVAELRRRVGMVYAVPVALPRSVFENVVFGPRLKRLKDGQSLREIAEGSLKAAFLWDEVKDRLDDSALKLSGGQQQRLCIARAIALEPEVLLLDEPCSGLDPISTAKIEEALAALKSRYPAILVTNNVKQAARVSDRTAFFLMGELVECGPTDALFTNPSDKRTNDYVTGRFG